MVNKLSVLIRVNFFFQKMLSLGCLGYPNVPMGVYEICPQPKLSESMCYHIFPIHQLKWLGLPKVITIFCKSLWPTLYF